MTTAAAEVKTTRPAAITRAESKPVPSESPENGNADDAVEPDVTEGSGEEGAGEDEDGESEGMSVENACAGSESAGKG